MFHFGSHQLTYHCCFCVYFTGNQVNGPLEDPYNVKGICSGVQTLQPSSEPSQQPSELPSMIPSSSHSLVPSKVLSSAPSGFPSELTSELPSLQPSSEPSLMPSESPSGFPSECRSCVFEERMAEYSEVNGEFQQLALTWLADDDPLQLALDTEINELLTRYALVVLYETTTGSGWDSNNWRSASAVATCDLTGVDCAGDVIDYLDFSKSNGYSYCVALGAIMKRNNANLSMTFLLLFRS
jgi:hypothetical protein